MSTLSEKTCIPCREGSPTLPEEQRQALLSQLSKWSIQDNHHLSKTFTFPNFARALDWVNCVGEIAEQEGHHPDIYLAWGKVRVDIWTHKIDNLTESDFVLAAKIDGAESKHS